MCVRVTMPVPVCVCACVFACVFFYNVSTVDKWRVVLKGETPDYINASSINVSSSTNNTLESILHKYQYVYITYTSYNLFPILSHWQGYKCQRAFIITQGPMSSTARDFWKMVHDRKCGVIVMLSNLLEGNEVGERDGHEGKDSKVETVWKNGRRERGWNKRCRSKKGRERNEIGREMCKICMVVAWREFE